MLVEPIEIIGEPLPELLPIARGAMESMLKLGSRVLEFGSGHSTVWLASRSLEVVSIESSPLWFDAVNVWLDKRLLRADVRLTDTQVIEDELDFPDNYFDLLFDDGYWYARVNFLKHNMDKVKPGGWVVFDDTNWQQFRYIPDILMGWSRYDVYGTHLRKTGISKAVVTSFYQKPKGNK